MLTEAFVRTFAKNMDFSVSKLKKTVGIAAQISITAKALECPVTPMSRIMTQEKITYAVVAKVSLRLYFKSITGG